MNWIRIANVLFFIVFTTCLQAQNTRIVDGKTFQVHSIGKGETLSKIANQYSISLQELKFANKGLTENIQAGQELLIPTKKSTSGGDEQGVHVVQKGETISAIAAKYGISQVNLKTWNKLKGNNINLGQKLIVADNAENTNTPATPKPVTPVVENASVSVQTHSVAKGETFYSIARKYSLNPAELKKANKLENLNLKEGQILQIPGVAAASTKPEPPVEVAPIPPPISQKPVEVPPAKPEQPAAQVDVQKKEIGSDADNTQTGEPGRTITNSLGYERVLETGLAEFIDNSIDNQKHLCLHKTAPVGSIIQVKNELNGAVIFVKVVGKLPDTGNNDRLILKISKRAYEKLGATGKRFPVEVSYPNPI